MLSSAHSSFCKCTGADTYSCRQMVQQSSSLLVSKIPSSLKLSWAQSISCAPSWAFISWNVSVDVGRSSSVDYGNPLGSSSSPQQAQQKIQKKIKASEPCSSSLPACSFSDTLRLGRLVSGFSLVKPSPPGLVLSREHSLQRRTGGSGIVQQNIMSRC